MGVVLDKSTFCTCSCWAYYLCADPSLTPLIFCLGTGVGRHSAGGVGTYVVHIVRNAHA